tara:strand:+ start:125 stop:328 length:204 start_codon:yes stop_codon:yes gene_type:complete
MNLSYDEWRLFFHISLATCSFIFGMLVGGTIVSRKFERFLNYIYFNVLTNEQRSDIMKVDLRKIKYD